MKKILSLVLTLALILGLCLTSTSCGSEDEIIVQTNAYFAPFEYSEGTEIVGVDVEIMNKVAEKMGKPFIYVRSAPKGHGLGNQIEGSLPEGAKVVVVEDLVSTGVSSLSAVEALRAAGAEVMGMVAIFTYGFPIATEAFAKAGVTLDTLSNYETMIPLAAAEGYVSEDDMAFLQEWRKAPDKF